jgi:tetratricopeptide (TPR) repeat protein
LDYSKHIQKAEEALRRRNWDFAVQLYQQLLELDPNLGPARAGLRKALRERHAAKGGKGLFGKLKGAGPLAAAKGLAKAGRHEAAAKSYESYLATNPLDEEANLLLGMSLEAAGHTASALAVYEFLAEIAPRNPNGLKRAGAMMAVEGQPLEALAYYERALEADPRDRDALKARKDLAAEAALHQGRYDQVAHSREQIKDKGEALHLERKQRRVLSAEELQEELARLEERFAENASDVELMLEMAEVHEKLRDPEAALDLVERAQSYRQEDADLAARAGKLRVASLKRRIAKADKLGDTEEADRLEAELGRLELEELRAAVARRPGDGAARLTLGRALLKAGELDQAAGELQKAQNDPRNRDEAVYLLAQCFHQKGFLDLARKEYAQALGDRPDSDLRAREILYHLGAIAEAEGDSVEARACYARIYQVDIGFRDVAQKMEQLAG